MINFLKTKPIRMKQITKTTKTYLRNLNLNQNNYIIKT